MDQRRRFVADAQAGKYSFSELCQRYGISRQNGYKWMRRFRQHGFAGLCERSRAPKSCPHKTPQDIEQLVIAARKAHPTWGAATLVGWIANRDPTMAHRLPAASTAHDILVRHGLVRRRQRRKALPPTRPPVTQPKAPNDVWTMDYKGEFRTRDGKWCYPLTIADDFSRFLLDCQARPSNTTRLTKPVVERAFRKYGLPRVILTDNGAPFGTSALARLSKLSLWWIRLGIRIERIEPGKPQQNPRHERMHKTLKRDTARPPAGNARAQQRAFNRFRYLYNHEKPHSSLSDKPPANYYCPSHRPYPETLPELDYPNYFETRIVSNNGYIQIRGHQFFLSNTLRHEVVGIYELDDALWSINYGPVELARYDQIERTLHTGGAHGPRALNPTKD